MTKKVIRLAQELITEKRGGGWFVKNDVYYYFSTTRVLAITEPIEEIGKEYLKEAFGIANMFKSLETEDYLRYEIKHDLKKGIKNTAGRCYGHDLVWKQKDMPATFNPRYILSAMDILKTKAIYIYKWNAPCFMFGNDDFQSSMIMLILPRVNESLENGFYDRDNGKKYIPEEDIHD